MQNLHKDEFSEMNFEESEGIHYHIVYPTTQDMANEQFKDMLLTWLRTIKEVNASISIVDTRNMLFPITPDLQEWVAKVIVPQSPTKKAAFVVPADFIAGLAIEQYVDEANEAGAKVEGHFSSLEEARAWLLR